jgi:hypothetical protein
VSRLLLFLAACDTGAESGISFPPGDAESVVVAYHRDTLRMIAAPSKRPIQMAVSDDSKVELLAYAETLEELGLEEGPIRRGEGLRRLPSATRVFVAAIDDGAISPWDERPGMSAEVMDFPIPGDPPAPCAELEVIRQRPISKTFCAASGEVAILCTREGLSRIEAGDLEPIVDLPAEPRGLAVEPDGRTFWVSTVGGDVFRGDLTAEAPALTRVFTSTANVPPAWIAADEGWILGLTERGVLERFDGRSAEVIYRFPDDHTLGAGVVRTGIDEAVAVHQVFGLAVRYRAGVILEEGVDGAELFGFSTAAHVPGVGTVVGTEFGKFFAHDGESWRELPGPSGLRALTIVPTADGFFYGAELGNFGEYRRDFGFCPPLNVHPEDVWRLLVDGGRVYLASRGSDGEAILVIAALR